MSRSFGCGRGDRKGRNVSNYRPSVRRCWLYAAIIWAESFVVFAEAFFLGWTGFVVAGVCLGIAAIYSLTVLWFARAALAEEQL